MRIDFSEFSFGYSFLRELENQARRVYPGVGRPVLPTLRAERTLGYDAAFATIGRVFFLQFKLGEFVSRRHPTSPTWGHFGASHYRFAIDTSHHQFAALRDLSTRWLGYPVTVAYAAPRFHESTDFTQRHVTERVIQGSYSCDPVWVPSDGHIHQRAVTPDGVRHHLFSDPIETKNAIDGDFVSEAFGAFGSGERIPLSDLVGTMDSIASSAGLDTGIAREVPGGSQLEVLARLCTLVDVVPMLWRAPRS